MTCHVHTRMIMRGQMKHRIHIDKEHREIWLDNYKIALLLNAPATVERLFLDLMTCMDELFSSNDPDDVRIIQLALRKYGIGAILDSIQLEIDGSKTASKVLKEIQE